MMSNYKPNSTSDSSATTTSIPTNEVTIATRECTQLDCAQYFEANQNNIKVLMAMSVGLIYKDGTILKDFKKAPFPTKKRKQFVPSNKMLIEEILRRKEAKGEHVKVNKQMNQSAAMDWLLNNPVENEDDVQFVLQGVSLFLEASQQVENETSSNSRDQWSGMIPFIRLIHCLVDSENTMEAFKNSFKTLSKDELDGRNNSGTVRICPWDLISQNFNNAAFNPTSTVYSDLHDKFLQEIDISHVKVANMGLLTPDKAKAKFFQLKNALLIVKRNWEKSGNGDGSAVNCNSSFSSTEREMVNGNDRRNFLNGKSPAVLYLWEKANEYNLLETVCQQLNEEAALDSAAGTSTALSVSHRKDKRKRDNKESDEHKDRMESKAIIDAMNKSNRLMEQHQRMKLVEMISEKRNEIDDIQDKLEDTFLVASEHKRQRMRSKMERIKNDIEILEKTLVLNE